MDAVTQSHPSKPLDIELRLARRTSERDRALEVVQSLTTENAALRERLCRIKQMAAER